MDGGLWIASYVLLWAAVLVLGLTCIVLLRQIGVLHARLRPIGGHFAGEGPERNAPAPPVPGLDYGDAALTLLAFTSPACDVCAELVPSLRAIHEQYDEVRVDVISHDGETRPVFTAFNVRSMPYLVTVDRGGVVRVRGVANSLEQAEVMIEESLAAEPAA